MTRYLMTIHRPKNYDGNVVEDAAMKDGIDALNREMVVANIRVFVGGLKSETLARSITLGADGQISVCEGPYLQTTEHVGGLWVMDLTDEQEAIAWGAKAAAACRAAVEVRPFH